MIMHRRPWKSTNRRSPIVRTTSITCGDRFAGWATARLRRAHHYEHGAKWWARCALPTLQNSIIRSSLLVRNAVDRAFVGPDGRPRHRLDHFAGAFGIVDPLLVEVIGTGCDALRAFAGIDHAGVAAVHQLEEMVLRLAIAA